MFNDSLNEIELAVLQWQLDICKFTKGMLICVNPELTNQPEPDRQCKYYSIQAADCQ